MTRKLSLLLPFFCLLFAGPLLAQRAHKHMKHTHAQVRAYTFVENIGQWPDEVAFKAHVNGGNLWLQKHAFTYGFFDASDYLAFHGGGAMGKEVPETPHILQHAIRMEFDGAFAGTALSAKDETSGYYNYMQGRDRSKWKGGAQGYHHITYTNLYEDIDLLLYSKDELLKYDLKVHSYANPAEIKMHYHGATALSLQKGKLIVQTSINMIQEQAPYAYQIIDGKTVEVACRFTLNGDVVGFEFPKGYDETYDLIIDPTLIFATYSGSVANNFGMTATYDANGNLISAGTVFDNGFPTTTGAYDSTFNGVPAASIVDVIVTKYTADGANQIWSTYLGGAETETAHSLIENSQGELCLYGVTSSLDFPVTPNAYDTTFNGGTLINWVENGTRFNNGTDIWSARFSTDGTQLLACTYIGGTDNDGVNYINPLSASTFDSLVFNYGDQFRGEIMIDSSDNIFIATSSRSSDFPIVAGFDNTLGGTQDGVILKLDPDLTTIQFSSFIGSSALDAAYNVKIDDNDLVYVCGGTGSANGFPVTPGAYNTNYNGGECDAYILKIDPSTSTVVNGTYFGTGAYDQSYFLELDRWGKVYVYGQTEGATPVSPNVYNNPNSGQFIARFNNTLSTLELSTEFGNGSGQVNISPAAFLVDFCGNVYCTGWGGSLFNATPLTGMPLQDEFMDETAPYDGHNFYLIVLSRDFENLLYGSYFGGETSWEHVDGGTSRFDKNGIVYQSVCAGCQNNDDFPTTLGAWSSDNLSTGCNNGMFKYDFEIVPQAEFTPDLTEGCAPLDVFLENTSPPGSDYLWDFGNGDTTSQIFSPTITLDTPGTYQVFLYVTDTVCLLTDTAEHTIIVHPPFPVTVTNDSIYCDSTGVSLIANGFGQGNAFHWSTNPNFTDTLNNYPADSTITVNPGTPTYYYVTVDGVWCSHYDSVLVTSGGDAYTLSAPASICIGDTALLQVTWTDPNLNPVTFDWQPAGLIVSGQNTATASALPTQDTTFYVTLTDNYGCTWTDSIDVAVFNFGGLTLNVWADQDTIETGESTMIHVDPDNSAFNYQWIPTVGLTDPFAPNTLATPEVTTTYIVTLTSGTCSRSGSVTLYVIDVACEEPDIFIPNAFTPNNDQDNDVLYVRGNYIEKMTFRIYNRWGQKVFESQDQSVGWDGTFEGRDADPAVFDYYLEVTCIGQRTFFKKGNITLIR